MKSEQERARQSLKRLMGIGLLTASAAGCDRATQEGAPTPSAAPGESASAAAAPAPSSSAPVPEPPPAPIEDTFRLEKKSPLSTPVKMNSCAVDLVNDVRPADGTASAGREQPVHINGWAGDGAALKVPPVVVVQLVGAKRYYIPAFRYSRPDVAEASKAPEFVHAGYQVMAWFKDVEPGVYAVQILQVNAAGEAITCDPKTKIKVE
jgi:hypothetical protein